MLATVCFSIKPSWRFGLPLKNYMVSEDGLTLGAVYLWRSPEEANRLYTADWKKFVIEKHGVEATLSSMHAPLTVDDLSGEAIVTFQSLHNLSHTKSRVSLKLDFWYFLASLC